MRWAPVIDDRAIAVAPLSFVLSLRREVTRLARPVHQRDGGRHNLSFRAAGLQPRSDHLKREVAVGLVGVFGVKSPFAAPARKRPGPASCERATPVTSSVRLTDTARKRLISY